MGDMAYRADWMTDDQWACVEMLAHVRRGHHHINGKIHPWGSGIKCNHYQGWATYDFDQLTRLVVLAHDYAVRVEVVASGPQMIGLVLHKRKREGAMHERHPTIEEAIEAFRK